MKICGYEVHPACAAFPEMPPDELAALARDIQTNGLEHPIVLMGNVLVDGRHRLRACKQVGVEPRFAQLAEKHRERVTGWIVSENLLRRHLSTSQRAMLAAELQHTQRRSADPAPTALRHRVHGGVHLMTLPTIAALFVDSRGCYTDLPNVDPWDESRDARLYQGPHPVVAHPPCARWCRLAGLVEKRWGKRRSEDGGCFESALASVRRWGGVLEHPAYSDAWARFGLPVPNRHGWTRGICGGWSCHVEQGRYGHPVKKATWLYVFGVDYLPTLRWGSAPDSTRTHQVSWCGNHTYSTSRPRLSKRAASATPPEFCDVLLSIARSVCP